jgi:hypothetical protein
VTDGPGKEDSRHSINDHPLMTMRLHAVDASLVGSECNRAAEAPVKVRISCFGFPVHNGVLTPTQEGKGQRATG